MRRPLVTAPALALAGLTSLGAAAAQTVDDPFRWLEDVQGDKALAWAKEHNAKTIAVLEARPEYKPIYARTLQILDSKEKIPTPSSTARPSTTSGRTTSTSAGSGAARRSPRTARPPRSGRRCSTSTRSRRRTASHGSSTGRLPRARLRALHGQPLARAARTRRSSASSTRRRSSSSPGGFSLPEAKSFIAWHDEDTLWVGTDFGSGSLTSSGYPAHREAVEARHAAFRGPDRVRGQARRRRRGREDRDPQRRAVRLRHADSRVLPRGDVSLSRRAGWSRSTCPRTPGPAGSSGTGCSSRCAATGPRAAARPTARARCWR